ncbi:MAG: hypothetical protein ACMG6E_01695 [Candidatus Roizmanbacteria bacterium]
MVKDKTDHTVTARIIEVEMYYHNEAHRDPFVHCDEGQLTSGCWYFHRQNGKGYKAGTFKGLDITCGDAKNKTFGGILIRSIMVGKQIIEGPCKVVDWILVNTEIPTIAELVQTFASEVGSVWDTNGRLYLDVLPERDTRDVHAAPRYGLTLKGADNLHHLKFKYIMKKYRFTTHPSYLSKDKCLLGLSVHFDHPEFEDNFRASDMAKWLALYEEANSTKKEDFCGSPLKTIKDRCEAFYHFAFQ